MHGYPVHAADLTLKKIRIEFLLPSIDEEAGTVQATCTDGKFFVTAWCDAEVHEEGEGLFQSREIISFLKRQNPDQQVSFETEQVPDMTSGKIVISGQDIATAEIWNGEYFPRLDKPKPIGQFILTDEGLKTLLVVGVPTSERSEKKFLPNTRCVSVCQIENVVCLSTAAIRYAAVETSGIGEPVPPKGLLAPIRYLKMAKRATGVNVVGYTEGHMLMEGKDCWSRFPTDGDGRAQNPHKFIHYIEPPIAEVSFGLDILDVLELCQTFGGKLSSAQFEYHTEGYILIKTFIDTMTGRKVPATPGQPDWTENFSASYMLGALRDVGLDAKVRILPSQKGLWARVSNGNRHHIFMSMVPPKGQH